MVLVEIINCVPNRNHRSNIFLDLASQCRLSACCDNIWLTWDCKTDAILSICFSFELLFSDSIALKYAFNVSGRFSTFKVSKNLENRGQSIQNGRKSRKMNPKPFFASSALPSHIIWISNLEDFPCTFTTGTLSVLKRHLKSHLEVIQFFLMRPSKINPKTSTWGQQWIKYL